MPNAIYQILRISNEPRGTEYWLWNLKENIQIKYKDISESQFENIRTKGTIKEDIETGLYLSYSSIRVEKYPETLDHVLVIMKEYVNTWKIILKQI